MSDGVYTSSVDMPLTDYIEARKVYCIIHHSAKSCVCRYMVQIGDMILEKGYVLLSKAFRTVSPHVAYTAERAKRNFLQMSLVSIRVGDPIKGMSFTILLEHTMGVDYHKMGCIINNIAIAKCSPQSAERMEKSCAKMLLTHCSVGQGT